MALLHGLQVSL